MARNELAFAATPEVVWAVLSDPASYAYWVVGSSAVRDWDARWPAPGSRFRHRIGAGLIAIRDYTEVVEAEPPRRLLLHARAGPLGSARIELRLRPHPAGALVTMSEHPGGIARLAFPPPAHLLLQLRNGESLRRLRRLAEQRALTAPTARVPRRRRSPSRRTPRGGAR